ncbi:MAG: VCBS repeat-containing protein, partial [Planctomycetota bacterium]
MRLPALPLLLLAAPASAQFTPFQEIGLSLVSSRDVQVVDFDGDGVPDLIAPDRATRQIVLYLGLGGGAFDQGRLLGGGPVTTMDPGPTVVAAGDLDGDGDPDIVALSEEGQSVVLENLGNGTTGAPIPLPNVPNARTSFSLSIQLYDIDGDGRLDVVQSTGGPGSGNSGGTYYQLNLGGLTFGLRRQLTQSFEPGGVAKFGDIDGDGDDDTLVNHPSGRDLYWIRNDGALPRTVLTALPWNPSFGTLLDAELGDIDQDGDLDVLAAGSTIDRIYLFENDGAGQFAAFTVAVAGNGTVGDFELVDLEGDGDLDVVWTRNPGGRRLQWVENLGGGTFSSVRTIQGGLGFWRIQVADLDQDGVLDIVAQEPQQTYWLRGSLANPVPSFGPPIAVDQVEIARLVDVALTDVDLDADLDVVGVTFPSGSFAFAENVGEGEFLNPTIEATGLGESYRGLRTADLDGDGDLDFAPIPISNTQLYWFENPGDFTVGSRVVIQSTGDNEIDLQFADVDGDGDLDAVTLARLGGAGVLSWVSNPGDGSFGAATAIATLPAGAGSLEIGDMDLDGVLDLFVTDSGPVARVVFLRGLGAGTFASPVSVLPPGSGRVLPEFALVDVDVDGFLDVVQVRELFSGDRIEWVRNVGGVFVATATEIQTVVEGFSGLQGADLDGDGDDDLLLSNGIGFDGAIWLENP